MYMSINYRTVADYPLGTIGIVPCVYEYYELPEKKHFILKLNATNNDKIVIKIRRV